MKELELTLRVRNNRLKERRDKLGLSQKEIATAVGIETASYGRLETMRDKPTRERMGLLCFEPTCTRKRRRPETFCRHHLSSEYTDEERGKWIGRLGARNITVWTDAAQRLAQFYEVEPEELFPAAVQQVKTFSATKTFDAEELQRGLGIDLGVTAAQPLLPDAYVAKTELAEQIQEGLSLLSPAEENIVRRRFGLGRDEQTYEEIADEIGRSRERVRQVEQKALRKLSHPSRSRNMKSFVEEP